MLKFLNVFRAQKETPMLMTHRQQFERALEDMNTVLQTFDVMPAVTLDPASRTISITPPDQFPDEALALPKPDPENEDDTNTALSESKNRSDEKSENE